MNHVKNLHNNYVITLADKVADNLAFICQRFYPLVLVKEPEIDEDNNSNLNSYVSVTKFNTNNVNHYETFLKKEFHIALDSRNRELPHMYRRPNLHKNPSKCKFIVDDSTCLVKPLSKDVTSALKRLHQKWKKVFNILGVKIFWTMQSKDKIIKDLFKLISRNKPL